LAKIFRREILIILIENNVEENGKQSFFVEENGISFLDKNGTARVNTE